MEFIVEGDPQGKARPRFSQKSGTVYTPAKTAKYEKLIRKTFLAAGGKAIPSDCYVGITVDAYFQIPKSYTKGKRLACQLKMTSRWLRCPAGNGILRAPATCGSAWEK
jgi:Holliday junction resolvase RusA-like endonuclease